MMWVALAFMSAALLGCYDFFKKVSLKENAVIPVLFLNTLFSALLFLPFIILSRTGRINSEMLFVPAAGWGTHLLLIIKAIIVLSSWMCGYFAMKHLRIRNLSYSALIAPNTAAATTSATHLLCLKSIPSFFPLLLSRKNDSMATDTPIH